MTLDKNFVDVNPPMVIEGAVANKNDIDIIEIFFILINHKKTIFFVTLVFVLAGLLIGLLLPQKWTSTSVIVAPTEFETLELDNLLDELHTLGVETGIESDYLLTTTMQFFDSRVLREGFLQDSDYFKMLMRKYPDNEFEKRRLLDDISTNNISISGNAEDKATGTKTYRYLRLKISARSPDAAKILLQGYIDYIGNAVNKYVLFKIQRAVISKVDTEEDVFSQEMQKIQSNRLERIKRLEYALSIANVAGVQKPVYSKGGTILDDPDYPITLGAEALRQKLNVEKNITDPLTMNSALRNMKMNIDMLRKLKISSVNFKPFRYLQIPEVPTQKEQPRRLIILLLSTIIGLMVAVGVVLLQNTLVKRHGIIK